MSEDGELPTGWCQVPFGEVCEVQGGFAFKSTSYEKEGVPLVRIGNLVTRRVELDDADTVFLPNEFLTKYANFVLNKGDVLIALSGATTGKMAVYDLDVPALLNQRVARFSYYGADVVFQRFTSLLVDKIRSEVIATAYGAAQPNISPSQIKAMVVRIPPFNEQRRIVSKIEELFSDLDAGVAALKRAKANLKRYRAAVLKAAVEGKLTEEWRAKHPHAEPASKLLARILTERRQKWESDQLAKFAAAGKQPPKGWKEKYIDPTPPDTTDLPELPAGWCWVSWEHIISMGEGSFKRGPFGSALTKAIFVPQGYKVYEQYCPINDDCSYARYYITEAKFRELEQFAVRGGDYLISCSGVTLGRITQVPERFDKGIINQALLRVRIDSDVILHGFFVRLFRSPFFQRYVFENSTGSAIPNVKGVKELKAIPVPLPPFNEQEHLTTLIDEKISQISAAENEIDHSLIRAARLRQSILKQAFEGNLVPQDPNDEPASVFIENIRKASANKVEENGANKGSRTKRSSRKSAPAKREES